MVLAFILAVIVAAPLPISVPILSLMGFGAAGVGAGKMIAAFHRHMRLIYNLQALSQQESKLALGTLPLEVLSL
jgi:hypothetical protein